MRDARPTRPVPSRIIEPGSGTAVCTSEVRALSVSSVKWYDIARLAQALAIGAVAEREQEVRVEVADRRGAVQDLRRSSR